VLAVEVCVSYLPTFSMGLNTHWYKYIWYVGMRFMARVRRCKEGKVLVLCEYTGERK
jgi:hypothetical protein